MARARNIKPGFFESEQLGACPLGARLLFAAMWTEADREGRLKDRPMRLRAYAFPYDSISVEDVSGWMSDLEREKLIVRYEVAGEKYIWIVNFLKHQNPHQNEKESMFPAYSGASTVQVQYNSGAFDGTGTEKVRELHQSFFDSSSEEIGLIPDSLIPDSLIDESRSLDSESLPSKPRGPFTSKKQAAWFDAWWEIVWAKTARGAAERAFAKQVRDQETADAVMDGTKRFTPTLSAKERQFWPHPATWLNQKRWLDEPGVASQDAFSLSAPSILREWS